MCEGRSHLPFWDGFHVADLHRHPGDLEGGVGIGSEAPGAVDDRDGGADGGAQGAADSRAWARAHSSRQGWAEVMASVILRTETVTRAPIFSSLSLMQGELDGLGLGKEIRRRRPDLPVVLTTGYSEAASAAAENFRLLLKPCGIGQMEAVLGEAMAAGA